MAKPSLQEIHVTLEKHIAVSDERWKETILRIKKESFMLFNLSFEDSFVKLICFATIKF